ncbi:MAG: hypothetical protein J6Y03_04775 [Alphaproteobacteria bacterium]|nr:hypothetical protein [Alphaproteobacteria bacterium]
MAIDYKQQRLLDIYKKLYQYKDMLKGGANLTFDIDSMDSNTVETSFEQINSQLTASISYLLGLSGDKLSVKTMMDSLLKHYTKDDFWRKLLLDYIEIKQEEDEAELEIKREKIQKEGLSLNEKIREFQKQRKDLIRRFSEKIEPEKFPIDVQRMFKNYLHMADLDAEKAWDALITNPAFFSPIIVEDENGNRILSVESAKEINKKIGAFIKKMKA